MRLMVVAAAVAGVLWAQQFKFNLDHLADKASDSVDLSLTPSLLQLGASFLDSKDPDEAKVKKIVAGLEGLYIKHFEFKKEGQYTQGDVDQIAPSLYAGRGGRGKAKEQPAPAPVPVPVSPAAPAMPSATPGLPGSNPFQS